MSLEYIDNNQKNLLKKVHIYNDNFTKEQLTEYENTIFTIKLSRRKRAELELARLKQEISKLEDPDPSIYEEYLELSKLLKVADFDPSVIDEIYARIVKVQLLNGISIRLYTAFSLLQEQLEHQMKLVKDPEEKKVK